jgi:NHS family xanthosine MFS transporter
VIDKYFTTTGGDKNWHDIWLTFAAYALVVAILFAIFFRHKHDPKAVAIIQH